MKYWFAATIGCLSSLFALPPEDHQAIHRIIVDYTNSWNRSTGKGFSKDFSVDADFVNIYGMHFKGKQEIEDRHIEILSTLFKESQLEILQTNLREVNPDLVIANVYWKLDGYRDPRSGKDAITQTKKGIFIQVFVRAEKKWEITASQNTLVGR